MIQLKPNFILLTVNINISARKRLSLTGITLLMWELCKQLEANVFSTPVFKAWADKNVVLFKIDAPTQKQVPQGNEEQNTAMAQSLKVTTYPTIWILSVTHEVENGRFKVKPVGYTGYQPSPEKFIGVVQNFVRR